MDLRLPLFLLFIVLPIVEIVLLVEVGQRIGSVATVFLVVFGAVLGTLLIRHQGFFTLQRVRRSMARGEEPTLPMLEGAVLLLGGVLLLVPGFLTDVLGVLSLIPPVRRVLLRRFLGSRVGPPPPGPGPGRGPAPDHAPRTIEGEYHRED